MSYILGFGDEKFKLLDDGDATKRAEFELSGITTGNMRTLTVPDRNLTLDNITSETTTNLTSGFLRSDGSNASSQTSVDLTTDITGILPIANGGTESTSNNIILMKNSNVQAFNTVSETDLIGTTEFLGSKTVGANTLAIGDIIRFRAGGFISSTASSPTLTWKFKLGASGLGNTIAVTLPAIAYAIDGWTFTWEGNVRAIGASGSIAFDGVINVGDQAPANSFNASMGISAPVTVDTTTSNDFAFTVQWGTASSSNIFRCLTTSIDIIKTGLS